MARKEIVQGHECHAKELFCKVRGEEEDTHKYFVYGVIVYEDFFF